MHTIIIVDLFLSPWIVYTWLKIQKDDVRYLGSERQDVQNHSYMAGVKLMRDVTCVCFEVKETRIQFYYIGNEAMQHPLFCLKHK